ncbi:MAG TPA: aldehyde dehydrogenase family protein [Solirubrobacteraceae bacterium]|jgi:acyl-CoA reductase-like NAD-dependent aldehyde dehydrogenase|nr:aldehyde dehydrogenase family protein [Solirubrobacteraceae bacterium]
MDTESRSRNVARAGSVGDALSEPLMLIGGKSVPAVDRSTMQTFDPATGDALADFPTGGQADVDAAVEAARRAQPGWADVLPPDRGRVLHGIARRIRDQADELSNVESLDTGKPLRQAKADVQVAARYFEYYAGFADKLLGTSIPLGPDFVDYTTREPMGVSAQIASWNYPLQLGARGIAPALAAGNAIVVKPAEEAPLSLLALGRLAMDAGVPAGVINVVTGLGEEVGGALAGHAGINQLTFTGSVAVGTLVMQAAARNVVPVTLELGGKSPSILCQDADLDVALPTLASAMMMNAGQACSAATLVVCHSSIHDEVVDRIATKLRSTSLGAGIDDPDLGPLISAKQLARVESMVDDARAAGATVVTGGEAANDSHLSGGCFYKATLIDGASPDMTIAREEVFGPVMVVLTFDDDDQAVTIANGTGYGLVSSVWTHDLSRAHRFARRIRSGQVYVNTYGVGGGAELPFGGFGKSGFGREKGAEGLNSYLQTKNVCVKL